MDKGLHANHRQRMKEKFIKNGPNVFEDHELLELLLYYARPRVDTNPTAHRLLETFGSLNGVLDAPLDSICAVKDVGENSALLVKLCREIAMRGQRQEAERLKKAVRLKNSLDIVRYFKPKYVGLLEETVMVAYLDNSCRIIGESVFPPGTVNFSALDIRSIIKHAVNVNAAAIVLAHNHPGGQAEPSADDCSMTNLLCSVLHSMKIYLFDHLILGGDGSCLSMRDVGYLSPFRGNRSGKY